MVSGREAEKDGDGKRARRRKVEAHPPNELAPEGDQQAPLH